MGYFDRLLLGILIILVSVGVLWYGSPARTPLEEPSPAFTVGFVVLFALGFMIASMALMGAEADYPAFVSGFVLYFIVGALVAVALYVRGDGIGRWTLDDAGTSGFWAHWVAVAAEWPLEIVRRAGLLGYTAGFR